MLIFLQPSIPRISGSSIPISLYFVLLHSQPVNDSNHHFKTKDYSLSGMTETGREEPIARDLSIGKLVDKTVVRMSMFSRQVSAIACLVVGIGQIVSVSSH